MRIIFKGGIALNAEGPDDLTIASAFLEISTGNNRFPAKIQSGFMVTAKTKETIDSIQIRLLDAEVNDVGLGIERMGYLTYREELTNLIQFGFTNKVGEVNLSRRFPAGTKFEHSSRPRKAKEVSPKGGSFVFTAKRPQG